MLSTRLLNVGRELERALAKRKLLIAVCDLAVPLEERAKRAGVVLDVKVVQDRPARQNLSSFGYVFLESVPVSVRVMPFLNPVKRRKRCRGAANLDQAVSVLGSFPGEFGAVRIVCINTGIFLDDFVAPLAFVREGKGFRGIVLREPVLEPGDMVLMRR